MEPQPVKKEELEETKEENNQKSSSEESEEETNPMPIRPPARLAPQPPAPYPADEVLTKSKYPPGFIGPTRPRSEEFTRVKQLGTGNFSQIYLVEEFKSPKIYAMKEYSKPDVERRKKTQDLVMEKYVLKKLHGCKRVVELFETFKDEYNVYFLMENLTGGELWELMHGFGYFSRTEVKYWTYKIILALEEIHARGIVHRDLKPENIMLTENKTDIKLIDFATAWDFQNPDMKGSGNGSTGRRVYYHFVGTPQYMPVELIRNKGSFPATDIFALGCILYQLICGFPPRIGPGEYAIFKETNEGKNKYYPFFTEEEKELIDHMTKLNHEERINLADLKAHKYFQDNLQLYESTLNSYEELIALRTPQEKWLAELKEKILAEALALDTIEEQKTEEDAKLDKTEEINEKEVPNSPLPINHPDNVPKPKHIPEKKALVDKRIEEALKNMPEGDIPAAALKSRVEMLKRQLRHRLKIKTFEHYY
jgi:serine/threonine protein kinase